MSERCVTYRFQVNRPKVKVTQVVRIFGCVCSIARCICLQEVAHRVTYNVEINELFAFVVGVEGSLDDHWSTISGWFQTWSYRIHFGKHIHVFVFSFLSTWDGTAIWNSSSLMTRCHLSCIVNAINTVNLGLLILVYGYLYGSYFIFHLQAKSKTVGWSDQHRNLEVPGSELAHHTRETGLQHHATSRLGVRLCCGELFWENVKTIQ